MKKLILVALSFCFLHLSDELPAASSKPLVFARPGDSVGFDIARQEEGESINIAINIFESLVQFKSGTTEIEPALATSWNVSKDGTTYTFHLRKNVQFSDGTPFNADAVVFAIERQSKKDHPAHAYGAPYKYWENMGMNSIVKEVKKTDDSTVVFKLFKPNAPFLANVAMFFMGIPSPTAILKYKKDFDSNPVGTGPYTLKSWKKDDALELAANENYWGEKAKIKRVIVRVIPDNQVRLLELKRGAVHIMEFPNPSDLATVKSDPNIELLTKEGLNFGYMAFNMKKPPFDKAEVRQAISMAIDRKRILNEIYQGMGTLAKNPMPPFMLGYNDKVADIEYNPEKAKAALEKAGVKNLKLQLWAMPVARPYNPNGRKMAEFIQADLKRIGVEAKIVSYDWGTYLDKMGKGEHELALVGWNGDNGDPDNFIYQLYSKDSAMQVPTNNYSFYSSDEATALMKAAQVETNEKKRKVLYEKILALMAKDRPVMPIAHSKVVVPIRKEVQGYQINPTGDRRFAGVSFK